MKILLTLVDDSQKLSGDYGEICSRLIFGKGKRRI